MAHEVIYFFYFISLINYKESVFLSSLCYKAGCVKKIICKRIIQYSLTFIGGSHTLIIFFFYQLLVLKNLVKWYRLLC